MKHSTAFWGSLHTKPLRFLLRCNRTKQHSLFAAQRLRAFSHYVYHNILGFYVVRWKRCLRAQYRHKAEAGCGRACAEWRMMQRRSTVLKTPTVSCGGKRVENVFVAYIYAAW